MQKALLISVLIATFAIPAAALHQDPDDDRWKRIVTRVGVFTAFYAFALLYVYPRLA